jgi:hypothetical protein
MPGNAAMARNGDAAMAHRSWRYDVFETPSMFKIVDGTKIRRGDIGVIVTVTTCDIDESKVVEIAHAVTAATAAELVGISASQVDRLESDIVKYGVFNAGNLSEGFKVRRTCDES